MRSWPHFTYRELQCKCYGEFCNGGDMDDEFMEKLEKIRTTFGRPMRVTSGFRCPEYNNRHAATGLTGPHTTGKAIDILISGREAFDLLWIIMNQDYMRGLGFNQKGPHASRYMHIDSLREGLRPWIWSY